MKIAGVNETYEGTSMPPAHMLYFAFLIVDIIQARYDLMARSIKDSEIFLALKAHWILIATISTCLVAKTALALIQPIFRLENVCVLLGARCFGIRVLCILSVWILIWSTSSAGNRRTFAPRPDWADLLMRAA